MTEKIFTPAAPILEVHPNREDPESPYVTVFCPLCGREHYHGVSWNKGRLIREDRAAHCVEHLAEKYREASGHPYSPHAGYVITGKIPKALLRR